MSAVPDWVYWVLMIWLGLSGLWAVVRTWRVGGFKR